MSAQSVPMADSRSERPKRSEAARFIRGFEITNLTVGLIAALVTYFVAGPGPIHLGVVVGAAISVLNLRAMVWLGGKVIAAGRHSRTRYAVIFGLKLAALVGVVWATMSLLPVEPLGMMIGFSTILPAILLMTVKKSLEPVEAARKGDL
ncbi:MAG: ATP synthase subunit I [Deltaproteobacteria bacterium]|nr:MAG: ATP synthase subunit I [Deltaproteobacteria bacterium]